MNAVKMEPGCDEGCPTIGKTKGSSGNSLEIFERGDGKEHQSGAPVRNVGRSTSGSASS
jgi:hypothetical protein